MEEMRPSFLSHMPLGVSSNNAAHRIAVEWNDNGIIKEGVYIFRRDTDSLINSLAGGRLFPGVNKYSNFDISDNKGEVEFSMHSKDREVEIYLRGNDCNNIPKTSVFSSYQEISNFFKEGADGYSPARKHNCIQGLCLQTTDWDMTPFHVEELTTNFFYNQFQIPNEQMHFDSAVIMRNIQHRWEKIASIS
jgi:hypothetical protein